MATVKLSDIVDGMECAGDETRVYLDRREGKVVVLPDSWGWHGDEIDDGETTRSEWEREMRDLARAIREDDVGRFVALPDRFEINEWDMMRDFAVRVEDERKSEALQEAIHGRGAFRFFKGRVHEFGLADAWYKFRDDQYRQTALDWCRDNDVPVDADA